MKIQVFVGRDSKNDIVVDQPAVSKTHAKITFVDKDKIQIEDVGSTNGTFVNGEKILKKIIMPSDRVTLGSYPLNTETLFKSINKKVNEKRTDFTHEFSMLRLHYESYENKVDLLQKGVQTKPMYIKAGITLAAMAFSYFIINDPNFKYPVMTVAGIIGGFLSLNNKANARMKDEVDRLSVELQREYRCPKCGYSLMGKRWNYWAGLGACPQCNAKWVE
ncbi:hypothetical protein SDC9_32924 [bioreactor metagenome]|jgi:ribosomal protein L37AE/L43A|uniref:FHA domain-containing protein n=1 Tax=bioreactor metagenome TaxID=1076179 RepID=A0A644V6W1_9ZZZZ|nr:FHA domain-containing protein [Lentimicrobium sp.]MEA5110827.1 FHA domain-containing protein [Lentimicrobium sp.]